MGSLSRSITSRNEAKELHDALRPGALPLLELSRTPLVLYSTPCEYAIRALTYIALHSEGAPIQVKRISEAENIPHHFLAKIMNRLISKGIVKAMRGPGGGFVLSKPPRDTLVRSVIDAIDGIDSIRKQCVLGLDACRDDAPCSMHEKWKAFRESFLASVDQLTLENMADTLRSKRRRPSKTS